MLPRNVVQNAAKDYLVVEISKVRKYTWAHGQSVNASCTLKSLVFNPANTTFKVSDTSISPANDRPPRHRKPLMMRLSDPTMLLYSAYLAVASLAFLARLKHLVAGNADTTVEWRWYKHTGAAL